MKSTPRRWLPVLIGLCVAVAFAALSFRTLEFGQVATDVRTVEPLAFLIFPLFKCINFVLPAFRSKILFAPVRRLSLWCMIKSVLLAFGVNNVIPFRAGELARVGYLAHHGKVPASTCVAIVAFERLLDVFGLVLVMACIFPSITIDLPFGEALYISAAVVTIGLAGGVWVSRRPQVIVRVSGALGGLFGERIRNMIRAKSTTFAKGLAGLGSIRRVLGVVVITLLFWLTAAASLRMWMWAFHLDVAWYAPFVVLAILSFGSALPSSPGNIGTYHWFVIQALALVGVAQASAASYAVVVHVMAMVPFTLLAIPLLFRDYLEIRSRVPSTEPAKQRNDPA